MTYILRFAYFFNLGQVFRHRRHLQRDNGICTDTNISPAPLVVVVVVCVFGGDTLRGMFGWATYTCIYQSWLCALVCILKFIQLRCIKIKAFPIFHIYRYWKDLLPTFVFYMDNLWYSWPVFHIYQTFGENLLHVTVLN